jgi:hypothetical protein
VDDSLEGRRDGDDVGVEDGLAGKRGLPGDLSPSEGAGHVAEAVGPHFGIHGCRRRIGDRRRLDALRDAAVGLAAGIDRAPSERHREVHEREGEKPPGLCRHDISLAKCNTSD